MSVVDKKKNKLYTCTVLIKRTRASLFTTQLKGQLASTQFGCRAPSPAVWIKLRIPSSRFELKTVFANPEIPRDEEEN